MRSACETSDYRLIAETDAEFHGSIVRRARQRDLALNWTSLAGRVPSHFWETQRMKYGSAMEFYEEYAPIVEVFRGGDVESAVALLEERIN
jgi:DNA-binding GntR family transcriptional regulator